LILCLEKPEFDFASGVRITFWRPKAASKSDKYRTSTGQVPDKCKRTTFRYSYFAELRNIAVIELLFATGGRVSEISNLRNNQIDLTTGQVTITGKGNKDRIIQICNKETISVLKKYRQLTFDRCPAISEYFLVNRFRNRLSTTWLKHS
jgi:site-specific recombinase XerD